ncbi:MAG: hypothetical protein JWN20_841, partial [Jatrophihabitantaceae bacterium]|nr:hypothetical protein [Jatrophihabitantaceae bacterium]
MTDNRAGAQSVPVRTIVTVIGLLLATAAMLWVAYRAERVLVWLVIAAFFAVALHPPVSWVQRRLLHGRRRALATLLVFVGVVLVLVGVIAVFAVPLAHEGASLARQA